MDLSSGTHTKGWHLLGISYCQRMSSCGLKASSKMAGLNLCVEDEDVPSKMRKRSFPLKSPENTNVVLGLGCTVS